MAHMYYNGLVDVVISSDSDMFIYGVPTIFKWKNCVGNFVPYNTISRIADAKKESLANYLVDSIQQGCDYFKKRYFVIP